LPDQTTAAPTPSLDAIERVAARVLELAQAYEPPDFAEVPTPDAALFLAAIDHRTGYRGRYLVGGTGPYEGSALLWALGLRGEARRPGLLGARSLAGISDQEIAELFRIGGETVSDVPGRARLWRELAAALIDRHGGEAAELIVAAGGRLGGSGGLLPRLAEFEAFSDPLEKKSFLACKIWERRGWLAVSDPERWEVCADNVLMRLALRSGLVPEGTEGEVRASTRTAFKRVSERAGIPPPQLDDLLWELGRDDPDLLGRVAGDVREPPRPDGASFY
jgi:hypothetical protein